MSMDKMHSHGHSHIQAIDPILDPLLSIEAYCYGAARTRPQEAEVDYAPHVLESIQHFIGKDFQSSKITVLEGLFTSNLQFLQEGFPQLLDSTSARSICVLLENLLVSNNFTQNELVIAVFAVASAVTQCFSHASTTMEAIIQEREESKSNENSNAEEIETLQLNFYSLQKKCSSLMQIHENYKEEKELQIQEALQQCSRLKQQVEEAASYNFRQDDEIKRLTLALSQTEKAMDAGIVSSDVEKSRMEKKFLGKIHQLNDTIAALKDEAASTAYSFQERIRSLQEENKAFEELLENEKERKSNDESEDQELLLQLKKVNENQLFIITELRHENEVLQDSVNSFGEVLRVADDRVQEFENQKLCDSATIDRLTSEVQDSLHLVDTLRSELEHQRRDMSTTNCNMELNKILESQQKRIAELERGIVGLRSTVNETSSDLKKKNQSISEQNILFEKYKATIEDLNLNLEVLNATETTTSSSLDGTSQLEINEKENIDARINLKNFPLVKTLNSNSLDCSDEVPVEKAKGVLAERHHNDIQENEHSESESDQNIGVHSVCDRISIDEKPDTFDDYDVVDSDSEKISDAAMSEEQKSENVESENVESENVESESDTDEVSDAVMSEEQEIENVESEIDQNIGVCSVGEKNEVPDKFDDYDVVESDSELPLREKHVRSSLNDNIFLDTDKVSDTAMPDEQGIENVENESDTDTVSDTAMLDEQAIENVESEGDTDKVSDTVMSDEQEIENVESESDSDKVSDTVMPDEQEIENVENESNTDNAMSEEQEFENDESDQNIGVCSVGENNEVSGKLNDNDVVDSDSELPEAIDHLNIKVDGESEDDLSETDEVSDAAMSEEQEFENDESDQNVNEVYEFDDDYDELDDMIERGDPTSQPCNNTPEQNIPQEQEHHDGGDKCSAEKVSSDNSVAPPVPPSSGENVATNSKENSEVTSQAVADPPIVLIDIGSFYSHIGVWNGTENCFDIKYSCPSVVTRPSSTTTTAASLLQGASSLAGPMYNGFREHNAVAGEDAWYCAYSHPDAGLRGALTVSRPISSQGCVSDAAGFKLLLIHCLGMLDKDNTNSEGILVNGTTKVFVSHMLSFSRREFKLLADIVFDHFNFAEMSLLNQPILSSIGFGVPSLIVLDIGAYSTRVMPVYESFCLTQYVETTGIGGEHLTDYMELLLHGQQHEQYSSLLFRRRQQFARELKEKHGFIATSFEECVEMFGMFQFSYEKVMHGANDDKIKCDEGSKTESTKDIEVTASFACADGVNVDVTVDRERFYCPEVLFSPYLYEPCADEASITDIVIASMSGIDESLRNEISRTILVTGNSSQLAGLTDRLQIALSTPMAAFGVENFIVVTTCSPDKQQTVNEMMWKGCANTVSAAKSTQSTLPNLITSVEFEKSGESVFSALSE